MSTTLLVPDSASIHEDTDPDLSLPLDEQSTQVLPHVHLLTHPLPVSYPSNLSLDTLGKLSAKLYDKMPGRFKVVSADIDGHDLIVAITPTVSPCGVYWAMTALALAGVHTKNSESFHPIPIRD